MWNFRFPLRNVQVGMWGEASSENLGNVGVLCWEYMNETPKA